ncbi:MAG: hypothetical protein GEEBNDBF_02199 [bacterium]|nr:hypothetical protein [bacterium]
MKTLDIVALVLIVVGAVNWGLVGLAQFDLVATIAGTSFGNVNAFSTIVYSLVALAGIYSATRIPALTSQS